MTPPLIPNAENVSKAKLRSHAARKKAKHGAKKAARTLQRNEHKASQTKQVTQSRRHDDRSSSNKLQEVKDTRWEEE